ncbi:PID-CTERM protein-sorting domain-containing protein [Hymenobacter antarcticus]|uniref:VPDSG-CTERM protein sorting domain-containing protein n=1 Tax=Hymenobacter antarcticus TaxID=486270 RepID=A0ABP7PN91_9BACT
MFKHLFLASALLLAFGARAQAPANGGPTPTAAVTAVPLDGGASLLLAGGLAYGLRRLRQRRRA